MTDTTENDRTYTRIGLRPGGTSQTIAQVEQVVLGDIEGHPDATERYCRYLHIMTNGTDIAIELCGPTAKRQ